MGSLTVHVLNEDGNPIRGKRVGCIFVGSFFGIGDTNSEEYTDSDGEVTFEDIPTGSAKVFVDGKLQVKVSVGQNDHEDVTVTL